MKVFYMVKASACVCVSIREKNKAQKSNYLTTEIKQLLDKWTLKKRENKIKMLKKIE